MQYYGDYVIYQVLEDVLQCKTLQKECHWNTELTLRFVELTSIDHEMFYMVQANDDMIIPVNIGDQIDTENAGRMRICVVKLLDAGGHQHCMSQLLMGSDGSDVLQDWLASIDRKRYLSFYNDFDRIDPFCDYHLISVENVKYYRCHNSLQNNSIWEALGFLVSMDHNAKSWCEGPCTNFLMKYGSLSSNLDPDCVITEEVKLFHEQFSKEWNNVSEENRYKMVLSMTARVNIGDSDVLTLIAVSMNCVIIIVKPCTNGLGYVIVDAFCGGDMDIATTPYYILVSGGGHWFDALSVHGENTFEEVKSAEDIETVVREFLRLPRDAWNVCGRASLNATANSSTPLYTTPRDIILPVPSLPEVIYCTSSNS